MNQLMWDSYAKDLVLLVSGKVARECYGLHYSQCHWAKKHGNERGGNICEASDAAYGDPLNSQEARSVMQKLQTQLTKL